MRNLTVSIYKRDGCDIEVFVPLSKVMLLLNERVTSPSLHWHLVEWEKCVSLKSEQKLFFKNSPCLRMKPYLGNPIHINWRGFPAFFPFFLFADDFCICIGAKSPRFA